MEHLTFDATVDSEGPMVVFRTTPEASDAEWEVAQHAPSGAANATALQDNPSHDAAADVSESRNPQSGTKKNRAGKISREVRDMQESIQGLSQDVANKASSTEVGEALDQKVNYKDFQELVHKVDKKADLSQVEIMQTAAVEEVNNDSSQGLAKITDCARPMAHNHNGNRIEKLAKWMAAGMAGASLCVSGLAIGCCVKQQRQIEQLNLTMNTKQKAWEDLKRKKLDLMLEAFSEADYEYVQVLETQLHVQLQSLIHLYKPRAVAEGFAEVKARVKQGILQITVLLQPMGLYGKMPRGYGDQADSELTKNTKELIELVQRMAKHDQNAAGDTELMKDAGKLLEVLKERREHWGLVPRKYMYRTLHRSRM